MQLRTILLASAVLATTACGMEPTSGIDVVGGEQPVLQSRFRASFDAASGQMTFEDLPVDEAAGFEREQAIFQKVNVAGNGTPDTFIALSNSTSLGSGVANNSNLYVAQGSTTRGSCNGTDGDGIWEFGVNVENRLGADIANAVLRIDSFSSGISRFCHRRQSTQLAAAMPDGLAGQALYQFGEIADGEVIDSALFSPDGNIGARFTGAVVNFTFNGSVFAELP